jgi:hypothetical protein
MSKGMIDEIPSDFLSGGAGLTKGSVPATKSLPERLSLIRAAMLATIVRGVVTANIADLSAFTVAGNDGLTYVENDLVMLAGQTAGAQCGIYKVGAVAAGVAPLTRVDAFQSGYEIQNGQVFEVSEGTVWAGSSWKAMCTGAKVWGTDDPLLYPRVFKKTITLAAGTYTIGAGGGGEALFLFSTTKSVVTALRNTANTSTATTGGYAAPVASRIAGKAGTAAVLVRAEVAAGTINNADVSTLDVLITNW